MLTARLRREQGPQLEVGRAAERRSRESEVFTSNLKQQNTGGVERGKRGRTREGERKKERERKKEKERERDTHRERRGTRRGTRRRDEKRDEKKKGRRPLASGRLADHDSNEATTKFF